MTIADQLADIIAATRDTRAAIIDKGGDLAADAGLACSPRRRG